jgi:hypothetical protein
MSIQVQAAAITAKVNQWLATTAQARVLHVFNPVINLINEVGAVISITVPHLGRGPFSLMLHDALDFQQHVTSGSMIVVQGERLHVGEVEINLSGADSWEAKPDWGHPRLAAETYSRHIAAILTTEAPDDSVALILTGHTDGPRLQARFLKKAHAGIDVLTEGLRTADPSLLAQGARELAGLGIGLTPAGDDFLVGVMHGLWLRLPAEQAAVLCAIIFHAAVGRTNRLSQAWLLAASQGEAGEVWHDLLNASQEKLDDAIRRILPTGHTSGADALAGFRHVLTMELSP